MYVSPSLRRILGGRAVRLAGVLLVYAVAVSAPAAATADPAGTAVVTPNPFWEAPTLQGFRVANNGTGLTWDVNGGPGNVWTDQYLSLSGGGVQTLGTSSPFSVPSQVENGIAAVPQADPVDVTSVQLQPLAGGSVSTVNLSQGEKYLGFNGVGVVISQTSASGVNIVLRAPGQPDQTLAQLPQGSIIGSTFVDSHGMLFGFQPDAATTGPIEQVQYLDFASKTLTLENTDPQDSYALPGFMTATAIGWGSSIVNYGINLAWQSRSGGPQSRLAIGFPGADPEGIALSGSTIAYTANNGNQRYKLYLEAADGSTGPTLVSSTLGANNVIAMPAGGFAVLDASSQADPAINTVSSTGVFTPLATLPPIDAVVQTLSLSAGRLASEDPSDPPTDPGLALWSLQTTRAGSTVSVGSRTDLADDAYQSGILTSDDRTAYIQNPPILPRNLVVFDGSAVELSMPLGSGQGAVALSGDHLLLHTPGTSNWSVLNLATGASTPVSTNAAWIWGPYVYYQGSSKGQILRLDLTQPASATNPLQVRAADKCGIGPDQLIAWNTWVGYQCTKGTALVIQALNTSTHKTVNLSSGELSQLGDGTLAWAAAGNVLDVMNLNSSAHTVTTIGDLPATGPPVFALDSSGGQEVAWLASDDLVHVAPVPVAASKPALLDDVVAGGVSQGGSWPAAFDLSKPVSWKITIKNTAGTTVLATAKASAVDGSIRFSWNGQSKTGKLEPAGSYTWKLSTTGLDGVGSLSESGTLTIS